MTAQELAEAAKVDQEEDEEEEEDEGGEDEEDEDNDDDENEDYLADERGLFRGLNWMNQIFSSAATRCLCTCCAFVSVHRWSRATAEFVFMLRIRFCFAYPWSNRRVPWTICPPRCCARSRDFS